MAKGILLVEDDPDIRSSLSEILEDEGYAVNCAADGQDALACLRATRKPDLILLDLMMPGMSGPEFRAAQIRDPALSNIPVVVLTADGRITERAQELGAAAIVRKPIELEELFGVLERTLARRPGSSG